MNSAQIFRAIRRRLGVSQQALADAMGCSQGNVVFYERGQRLPAERAEKLIAFARSKGLALTFDHVYGAEPLPEMGRVAT